MQNRRRKSRALTFRAWLENQQDLENNIGDLARDALKDKGWQGDCFDSLITRMSRMGACMEALEACREAERQFRAL